MHTQTKLIAWGVAVLVLAMPGLSARGEIVFYDFQTNGGTTLAPASHDPNVDATAWTDGPNGNLANSTGQNKQALDIRPNPTGAATQEQALELGTYATMTLTPESGWVIVFDWLSFDYSAGGSAGVRSLFLRWSLDDFAEDLFFAETTTTWTSTGQIDLSGVGPVDEPVEFRLYTFNDESNTGRSVVVDNFLVEGVVIPEPATLALLAAGALAITRRRRR